jgi:hypothetical protein
MRLRRDAPRPGARIGPQSSANAREFEITFMRKAGYPEMRVHGGEGTCRPPLAAHASQGAGAALSM